MADYYESKFTGAEIDSRLESVPNKTDKVQNATAGNIATLKEDGGIEDSRQKLSDFAKVTDLQKKADLGEDGKVPENQLPSIGFMPQIVVTAPTGSTVTCTNGTKVLTAKEIEGTWVFDVPNYGEWTVSNGEVSDTIIIDTAKIYKMEISSQIINYQMLYDSGEECIDVTGGWESNNTTGAGGCARMQTVGSVNFSGYTKIGLDYSSSAEKAGETAVASIVGPQNEEVKFQVGESIFVTGISVSNAKVVFQIISANTTGIVSTKETSNLHLQTQYPGYYRTLDVFHAFLLKEDNWQGICEAAEIRIPDSMSSLLSDSSKLDGILASKSGVQYMIFNCTGEFMVSAIQSSTFLTALESSPYKEMVYANEHWSKFLAMVA